jgi:hypothetical protein
MWRNFFADSVLYLQAAVCCLKNMLMSSSFFAFVFADPLSKNHRIWSINKHVLYLNLSLQADVQPGDAALAELYHDVRALETAGL